jgi:hypothetical protein
MQIGRNLNGSFVVRKMPAQGRGTDFGRGQTAARSHIGSMRNHCRYWRMYISEVLVSEMFEDVTHGIL